MKDAAGKSACTLGPYFGPDLVMNGRNPHPWWPQKTLGFVDQRETLSLATFSFWSLNKYVLYIEQIQFVICKNTKWLSSKDMYSAGTLVQPNTEELISELLVGQNFWRSLTCPKMARYIAWFSWKSPSTHFWCNWKQATLPTSSPGGSRRVTDVFLGQFGKVCEIVFLCFNSSVFVSPKLIFSSMLYIQYSSMV